MNDKKPCRTCYYTTKGYCRAKGRKMNLEYCGWHTTPEEYEHLGENYMFKGAKKGDKYKLRCGVIAEYSHNIKQSHYLYKNGNIIAVWEDGRKFQYEDNDNDVIEKIEE